VVRQVQITITKPEDDVEAVVQVQKEVSYLLVLIYWVSCSFAQNLREKMRTCWKTGYSYPAEGSRASCGR
jgi:uncharacterized membrane protein YkvI